MQMKSSNLILIASILSLTLLLGPSSGLSQPTQKDPSVEAESDKLVSFEYRQRFEQLRFSGVSPIKYSYLVGGVTLTEASGFAVVLSANPIVLVTHEGLLSGELPGFPKGLSQGVEMREDTGKVEVHLTSLIFFEEPAMMGPGGRGGMGMGGGDYGDAGGMGFGMGGQQIGGKNMRFEVATSEFARIIDPVVGTLTQDPSSGLRFIFADHVVYDQFAVRNMVGMGGGMGTGGMGMGGMGSGGMGMGSGGMAGPGAFSGEKTTLPATARARLANNVSKTKDIWSWQSGDRPTLHTADSELPDTGVLIDSEGRVALRISSNTFTRGEILQEYLQVYNKLQKRPDPNRPADRRSVGADPFGDAPIGEDPFDSPPVHRSRPAERPSAERADSRRAPDRIVQSVIEIKSSQDPEEREQATSQLRKLLEIEFDAHRALKATELQSLKRRLEELELSEQALIEQRAPTIQQRLNTLLDISDESQ